MLGYISRQLSLDSGGEGDYQARQASLTGGRRNVRDMGVVIVTLDTHYRRRADAV